MSGSKKGTFWLVVAVGLPFGFIVFILAIVLYASIQGVQLTEESYYEKGLAYQERIDRIVKARQLEHPLVIEHLPFERVIVLAGPAGAEGTVRLVRPSNSRYDRMIAVELDTEGRQVIATDDLIRGLWRLEVDWRLDSVGYYSEARVVVP